MIKLDINGVEYSLEIEPEMPLLWVLREELSLRGTKFGCGIGLCGACTVHIDGQPVRSCSYPASAAQGKRINTIESIGTEDSLHAVQRAWIEHQVPQCGYCQAGQIMTASAFLKQNPNPSKEEIREAMHGNICRCASYNRIEKAVEVAAKNS